MFLNTELFGHQRGASNKGYKKIKKETLVLSTQNLHLGNANVNTRFEHGIVSPAYKTYKLVNCNPILISHWIKSERAKQFFFDATTVGASQCRRNVEWDTLYSQLLYLPSDEEQKKLANFLSLIEQKIQKQQQLVELLKKYKKGVLSKFFNQGDTLEIDFELTKSEWKKVKLSDVATFHQGLTYNPSNVSDFGTLVLRSTNIRNNTLNFADNVYVNISIPSALLVKKNDILMCVRNGSKRLVGKTALIDKQYSEVTWGAFMMIIRSKYPNNFIYHFLNSTAFFEQVLKDTGTGTINQITKSNLNECYINMPSLDTQNKICIFLDNLNSKIQNEDNKMELLIKLKKGLLQQLFV